MNNHDLLQGILLTKCGQLGFYLMAGMLQAVLHMAVSNEITDEHFYNSAVVVLSLNEEERALFIGTARNDVGATFAAWLETNHQPIIPIDEESNQSNESNIHSVVGIETSLEVSSLATSSLTGTSLNVGGGSTDTDSTQPTSGSS
jgi:hypothetical protein